MKAVRLSSDGKYHMRRQGIYTTRQYGHDYFPPETCV